MAIITLFLLPNWSPIRFRVLSPSASQPAIVLTLSMPPISSLPRWLFNRTDCGRRSPRRPCDTLLACCSARLPVLNRGDKAGSSSAGRSSSVLGNVEPPDCMLLRDQTYYEHYSRGGTVADRFTASSCPRVWSIAVGGSSSRPEDTLRRRASRKASRCFRFATNILRCQSMHGREEISISDSGLRVDCWDQRWGALYASMYTSLMISHSYNAERRYAHEDTSHRHPPCRIDLC